MPHVVVDNIHIRISVQFVAQWVIDAPIDQNSKRVLPFYIGFGNCSCMAWWNLPLYNH